MPGPYYLFQSILLQGLLAVVEGLSRSPFCRFPTIVFAWTWRAYKGVVS
jgi:hypothetical protein